MKTIIRQKGCNAFIIGLLLHFSSVLFAQTHELSAGKETVSPSLSLAGIHTMKDVTDRLNHIAGHVKKDGRQLIVHLVNWYRYDSLDMNRTMGWNGTGDDRGKIILTTEPLFGYYSCDDPEYIDWVLEYSTSLGVDELNIDYEGGVDYSGEFEAYYSERSWDSWFTDLLKRAEHYGMKISVMYEPKNIAWRLASREGKGGPVQTTDPSYPDEALQLLKYDLKKICDRFTVKEDNNRGLILNPVYKRVAGLPVIWIFGMTAGSLEQNIWKQAVEELYDEGYAFILVPNTYRDDQSGLDSITRGMNPWLDQLFTGFQSRYKELWDAAQEAAEKGNHDEARRLANRYIDEIAGKGLNSVSPVREVKGPGHFNITPLAIGFQDADVDAWGFRPPVYIEPYDRTRTEPGKLFRAYLAAAQKSKNQWHLICSGDDMAEQTHMLIPDVKYGFSGPYAIALTAAFLGKNPDIEKAIGLTEDYIRHQYDGRIPGNIRKILDGAYEVLPGKLRNESQSFKNN